MRDQIGEDHAVDGRGGLGHRVIAQGVDARLGCFGSHRGLLQHRARSERADQRRGQWRQQQGPEQGGNHDG